MDKVFLESLVALDVFGGEVAPEGRRVGPKGRHSRRVVFMVVHCASPDGCFCAVGVAVVVGQLRRKWAVKKGRDSGLEKRERCHRLVGLRWSRSRVPGIHRQCETRRPGFGCCRYCCACCSVRCASPMMLDAKPEFGFEWDPTWKRWAPLRPWLKLPLLGALWRGRCN